MRVERNGQIIEEEPWDLTEEDHMELVAEIFEREQHIGMRKVGGVWGLGSDLRDIGRGYRVYDGPAEDEAGYDN